MSTHHHEQIPAEEITKFVGRQLGNHLGQFIADNILLDKPGALDMEDCHDMTIRFRAQVHVLSPGEIRSLLQQAYDAGRAEQRWDCDFNS